MTNSSSHVCGRILAASLVLGVGSALAAPGELDTGFGDGGLLSLRFSEGGHAATAILQQADGKLIVVGLGDVVDANDDDFIVARLLEDGTLDPEFGTNGVSVVDFVGFFDGPSAAVLQSDGKIVLAGTVGVSESTSDIGLARFNANGTLDETFGTGGWATVDLGGENESALSVLVETRGRLVTAGYTNANGTVQAAFTRLNADGTPDTTFGTAGATVLDFGAAESLATDFAPQSDGRLVSVVQVPADEEIAVGIARLSPDGIPDPSFGTNGLLTLASEGGSEYARIAIQDDDSIVIAGREFVDGTLYGVLRRRDAQGNADNSFGTGGKAVLDESAFDAIVIQSDGMLAVTGYRFSEFSLDLIVSRFGPTGQLDLSFGIEGVATADFGELDVPAFSEGIDLIQQIDGKLAAVGRNFNTGSIALARFDDGASHPGRFGLTHTSEIVDEATTSSVTFTVRRTGGTTGPVSVSYETQDGSAGDGSDFVGVSGTFDWGNGDASDKSITIDLIDDSDSEQFEEFSLLLSGATGGGQIAASRATIGIFSLDGPGDLALVWPVFVLRDDHHVPEAIGVIRLPVVRSNGSEGEVSVQVRLNRGSATANSDFEAITESLTWADGDTSAKWVEVRIIDDSLGEAGERFDIQIDNPTGGATIASGSRQNVFIQDNDGGVSGGGGDGGGGGGGGALDWLSALALGLLGLSRLLLYGRVFPKVRADLSCAVHRI
jgi:uncharacterized delta-60 repeat protein